MIDMAATWRRLGLWRIRGQHIDRAAVLAHIEDGARLDARYALMVTLACGIALLGLLQNSVAVIIGAMLISPLMGPIIALGMSLATFDFISMRRALKTLATGIALALAIAIGIVLVSPLQEATPEILGRTEPTLFDLLVAVLSGIAGAYATITRKGETIVGVAIATALMPPLAVVGFGVATGNGGIAGGAAFLFMTNLLAIAFSATIVARWYRFGAADSPKQSAWQAGLIVAGFVLLSIPLGFALRDIAARGLAERTIRTALDAAAADAGGRISALRIDRDGEVYAVDAVLLASRHRPGMAARIESQVESALGRPLQLQLREVLTTDDGALAAQADSLARLRESVAALQSDAQRRSAAQAAVDGVREKAIAHLGAFDVLDGGKAARWRLRPQAGLDIAAARALESAMNANAGSDGLRVAVVPALQALPAATLAAGDLDAAGAIAGDAPGSATLASIAWALSRWDVAEVRVVAADRARGDAVAAWLAARGIRAEVSVDAGAGDAVSIGLP
jgi:uncharacterized hydrophobic protein (TIGR00271 family)